MTAALEPWPQWCIDRANQPYAGYRNWVCRVRGVTLLVQLRANGPIIGQVEYNEYSMAWLSYTGTTIRQQLELSPYFFTGDTAGITVSASLQCKIHTFCTVTEDTFEPTQPFVNGARPDGDATITYTPTRGNIDAWEPEYFYSFYKPGQTNININFPSVPTTRCDHAIPGNNTVAGCVFPGWTPTHTYYLSGDYPELATHIYYAQQSGLPGAATGSGMPNTSPLRRLISAEEQGDNRKTACPDRYVRPATKSCDEYPFASSRQGADTGGGPGRTFDFCQIPDLPVNVTGPTGYSACMIDKVQNSNGGTNMNQYLYIWYRVLDSDAYRIKISP